MDVIGLVKSLEHGLRGRERMGFVDGDNFMVILMKPGKARLWFVPCGQWHRMLLLVDEQEARAFKNLGSREA